MATNTNGSGHDPCSRVADDSMNSNAIGIEAGNDGSGEAWPATPSSTRYNALCAALCGATASRPGAYTPMLNMPRPGRSTQPVRTGTPRAPDTWDMAHFRADCDRRRR